MSAGDTTPRPALVFEGRRSRLVLPALAARLGTRAVARVGLPLQLRSQPPPALPGPGWMRLRPLLSGVCGSDVSQATLQADWDSPLSSVPSFPHVLGHEVVAEVVEPSADGTSPAAGSVVAVDPWLGCEPRGLPRATWCRWCASGAPGLCARAPDPMSAAHGRGMHLGHVTGLPGGFGGAMTAHSSRVTVLPEGLAAEAAVLCDPLAVAGHAVDRAALEADDDAAIVVLGAGTIGLSTVAVLRARHPRRRVLVSCAWPHLVAEARRLGAEPCATAQTALVAAVAQACPGARRRTPWRGRDWLHGDGAAAVIDTIGSAATREAALAIVRPRGRIVGLGVHRSARAQLSLGYLKEAELVGSNGYGAPPGVGSAFDEALRLLASDAAPASRWVTHVLALRDWRRALAIASAPGEHASIKVALRPQEA